MSDVPTDSSNEGKSPVFPGPSEKAPHSVYGAYLWLRNRHPLAFNFILTLIFGAAGGWLVSLQPGDPMLPSPLACWIQAAFGASAAVVGCYLIMDTAATNRGRVVAASLVFGFCGLVVVKQARNVVGVSGGDAAQGQIAVITEADNVEKTLSSFDVGNLGPPTIHNLQMDAVNLLELGAASEDAATQRKADAQVAAICSKLETLGKNNPLDVQLAIGPVLQAATFYRISGLENQLQSLQSSIGYLALKLPVSTNKDYVYVRWLNLVKTPEGNYSSPSNSSLFNTTPASSISAGAYNAVLKGDGKNIIEQALDQKDLKANTDIYVRTTVPSSGGVNWPVLSQTVGILREDTKITATSEEITQDSTGQYAQVWLQIKKDDKIQPLPTDLNNPNPVSAP